MPRTRHSLTSLVSVVMPVFNGGIYLDDAISSILNQTYENFEFIIIDDGSTDNSKELIKKRANLDNRIRFISRPNRGLIDTLNEALSVARGKYIARMDADDISKPERFKEQVAFLEENPLYVAVGTLSVLIDSQGDEIGPFGNWIENDEIDKAHLSGSGGAIIHPSVMIRSDALKSVGGYRAEFKSAEDIDLWLRLAELGKIANINNRLIFYRQHMDSIGHRQRTEQIFNTRKAVIEAHKRRNIKLEYSQSIENNTYSRLETYLKWGWWAYKANNWRTASKYAIKSLRHDILNKGAWMLLLKTIIKGKR